MLVLRDKTFAEKEMRFGDKIHIATNKHLSWKKARRAAIDMLDDDSKTAKKGRHAMAKESAKVGAVIGGIAGGISGRSLKGVAAGATVGAAGSYAISRVGTKLDRGYRNISSQMDSQSRRVRDQVRVAEGEMTKAEFIKKYGKNK